MTASGIVPLLQPYDAEAAGADAVHGSRANAAHPTRQYS